MMRFQQGLGCLLVAVCCWGGVSLSSAAAQQRATVETFDIEPVDCNGLTLNGVTYTFTPQDRSIADCRAGAFLGTRNSNNVAAPNLEGYGPGVLTLTFKQPTKTLGFGVYQFGTRQVTVELERSGGKRLRQEVPLELKPDPLFLGSRFDYNGPPIKRMKIRFETAAQFAIDNVTYSRAPGRAK